jgi:hypothetical protein
MARVAPYTAITQGTVFTCGCAEAYSQAQVHGLVITARCDAAHGKADIINYVPIVRIEDWIRVDGVRLLARRIAADALGQMKAALRDADMTPDILETQSPQEVTDVLVATDDKSLSKIAERFTKASTLRETALTAADGPLPQAAAVEFLGSHSKPCASLLRELLGHSIAEFHYLEGVDVDEDADGYVILLREIRYLPSPLVERLREGMDSDEFVAAYPDASVREGIQLRFVGDDPYAMPLSTVQSPDIELIVQRLTQLFGRVGVQDVEGARLGRLQLMLSKMEEPS